LRRASAFRAHAGDGRESVMGSPTLKRPATIVASLTASGVLLAVLYRTLDARLVAQTLVQASPVWLAISIGMIVPITALRALRFALIAPRGALAGIGEALRLTFAASALNVFLPAKSGDLIKSYFVATRGNVSAGVAVSIVVYERLSDLFGLIGWCLIGWLVSRPQVTGLSETFWWVLAGLGLLCGVLISSEFAASLVERAMTSVLPEGRMRRLWSLSRAWPDLLGLIRGRRRWIVPFSLGLWLTHLFQVWLFTVALKAHVPIAVCMSLSALALMAGQVPLTIAGLGTRDVALVVLMARYIPPEEAAALGLLMSTRNLLPPLLGMPVMWPYLSQAVGHARQWRSLAETAE